MSQEPTPSAADLDAVIAGHRNRWYGRGCAVGRLILDLDPGEYRDRLVAYLNLPVDDLGHAPIVIAVNETLGVQIKRDAVARHRRRACSCSDEVYS